MAGTIDCLHYIWVGSSPPFIDLNAIANSQTGLSGQLRIGLNPDADNDHPSGKLDEEAVAEAVFINKRTLARRLEKEGTGFRQLKDELLASFASSYLRETNLGINAIAELLNYSDSANSRRAFKRRFNTTPDHYRKKQREKDPAPLKNQP